MKAIIQTVKDAQCSVDNKVVSTIKEGLLVYFGIEKNDSIEMVEPFIDKILRLRIYRGEDDRKTNYSIMDRSRSIMLISQFTLCANLERGNRPSFDGAKKGSEAIEFYNRAIRILKEKNINVASGVFGSHMEIRYTNDGPETFMLYK